MDMTPLLQEAPSVGAIIFLVTIFMKYIRSRDKSQEEIAREVSDSNREVAEAIRENTRVIGANTEAMRTNTKLTVRTAERLDRMDHNDERKAS